MKIMREQVSFPPRSLLKVKWDDFPHFTYPWHFHSEFEIVYVLKSSGKRFVADNVEPFNEGDIILEGQSLGLSAGTGVAAGKEHILLFGGDPGIYFNRTERLNNAIEKASGADEEQSLWKEKDEMLSNHPGFSKDILAFNTRTKTWDKLDQISGDSPVTTSAFWWGETIVIPSGEIRPGIRTPKILGFDIEIKK